MSLLTMRLQRYMLFMLLSPSAPPIHLLYATILHLSHRQLNRNDTVQGSRRGETGRRRLCEGELGRGSVPENLYAKATHACVLWRRAACGGEKAARWCGRALPRQAGRQGRHAMAAKPSPCHASSSIRQLDAYAYMLSLSFAIYMPYMILREKRHLPAMRRVCCHSLMAFFS